MKRRVDPAPLTELEREEFIRLRAENEYIKAENEVIKKDRLETRRIRCTTTQGEKAAIVKELREKGYNLKYLLKAMRMSKSTYYYEIKKVDAVKERNQDLSAEIQAIFKKPKGRYGVRRVYKEACKQRLERKSQTSSAAHARDELSRKTT